jgi:antitoxin (DNA-binding transcriptional repressor) of toxin-antitoxin stability system
MRAMEIDLKQRVEEVGHRQLREELAPLLRRLAKTGRPTAVTNRNRVEAFIVPAAAYGELERARDNLAELRDVLPLLLAGAAAGARIPSETLERLGIAPAFDWKRLNAFQAAFPVRITEDEEGGRLPKLRRPMILPLQESSEDILLPVDD